MFCFHRTSIVSITPLAVQPTFEVSASWIETAAGPCIQTDRSGGTVDSLVARGPAPLGPERLQEKFIPAPWVKGVTPKGWMLTLYAVG